MNDDLVGTLVGGTYRVHAKLAEGGMGSIYRAMDERLERPVALKVIRVDLGESPEFSERFAREAKAIANVMHPGLVLVYAFGEERGRHYMALEFLEGRTLFQTLRDELALAPARAVRIAVQILEALEAIHQSAIVHRDLKPGNVMLLERDRVKVLDLGLAKLLRGKHTSSLTGQNMLIGTPIYMAPEQARGESVDARTDLYAAGIVLYEMLTGNPPFEGGRPFDILDKHLRIVPEPPSSRFIGVPAALDPIILRALAKKPEERYPSARAFADALLAVRELPETVTWEKPAAKGGSEDPTPRLAPPPF